jgi:hypothetical protein
VRFSPDGKKIASVSWDGTLEIANLPPLEAEPDRPISNRSSRPPTKRPGSAQQ